MCCCCCCCRWLLQHTDQFSMWPIHIIQCFQCVFSLCYSDRSYIYKWFLQTGFSSSFSISIYLNLFRLVVWLCVCVCIWHLFWGLFFSLLFFLLKLSIELLAGVWKMSFSVHRRNHSMTFDVITMKFIDIHHFSTNINLFSTNLIQFIANFIHFLMDCLLLLFLVWLYLVVQCWTHLRSTQTTSD